MGRENNCPFPNMINELETQLKEIFEVNKQETYYKVAFVLSQIDLSFLKQQSFSKFDTACMARLFMFRLIKSLSNYNSLEEYLKDNTDEAFMLGFYKRADDKIELPSKRTYNYYMKTFFSEEDKRELKETAKTIIEYSTNNNFILDFESVKKIVKGAERRYDKETNTAIRIVKRLAYSHIKIPMGKNSIFDAKDLLDVLTYVAINHDFTNNGSNCFKHHNPNKPCPSADTILYHLSKITDITEIKHMFEKVLDAIFLFAKRNYKLLSRRTFDIAYDVHKIPYYGNGIRYIKSSEPDKGTSDFFQFLTCSIVENGRRFILDVVPISPFDDLHSLLDLSLSKVKAKIKIGYVYMDRGFNSAKIIRVLKDKKVKFLMPMTRNPLVKEAFDKAEYCKARVFNDFKVAGEKVNLAIVNNELGDKHAFICNFDIHPVIAFKLYSLYSKRWGIETSYRNIEHDVKPRTTSRNYNIRLFYFLFSCCLYNIWVLVNIVIGLTVYGRIKEKPIIPLKYFGSILWFVKVVYDPG